MGTFVIQAPCGLKWLVRLSALLLCRRVKLEPSLTKAQKERGSADGPDAFAGPF